MTQMKNNATEVELNWYHIGWNKEGTHIREYGSLVCSGCHSPNNINFKTTKEEFDKLNQFLESYASSAISIAKQELQNMNKG